MAKAHIRSRTSPTGGRLKAWRKKRKAEVGHEPMMTGLADRKALSVRTLGNNRKIQLITINVANVFDPKTKKSHKAKIVTIKDNKANRNFVRRNIMTKGGIIETELGLARITSRPGQEGTVNAVLIK